jgi:N-acetylneuraminate synthase
MTVFIIAEIGINHNGDINIAKQLIDGAVFTRCDAVKFQKRTVEKVYSKEELDKPRESPWGNTVRDQKLGLEFGEQEYDEINRYCREKGIEWFCSAWDLDSQMFLRRYNCKYNKIASALLTHRDLLETVAKEGKYTFISTGMSTMDEIEAAVAIFRKYNCPFELMHCNSTYPMKDEDACLSMIPVLRERFKCKVGYSGHEVGLIVSCAAVALGATSIERHITLAHEMYGSDQAASVEVMGFHKLIRYVRAIEAALGNGVKVVTEEERKVKAKLRKVDNLQ